MLYHDESRWGLRTIRRRRITARGVKPVGTVQHRDATFWCDPAALPASGSAFSLIFLPPYSPELNPIERVWRQLRDRLAWQRFPTLDALEQALCDEIDRLTPAVMLTLIGYQPILRAITTVYEREYRLTNS